MFFNDTLVLLQGRVLKYIGSSLIILGWLAILWVQQPKDSFGTDFYPMYVAAHALLAGKSPYGPEVAAYFHALLQTLHLPFALVGFAYPLPAVIALWPLFVLPLPASVGIWLALGSAGSYISIKLSDQWRTLFLLPFCFIPLHRAIVVKQPTLIWFALIVLLLFAMRQHRTWLVGYCIVILAAKPQAGLLFSIVGLFWAWRSNRRTFVWIGIWVVLIWGSSFTLQPWWVQDWITNIQHYAHVATPPSLLPWCLLLLIACCRLPWYAQVAVMQVVLFPISDTYSALPLLLAWIGIGGPLALIGASISWVGILAGVPNTIISFWAFIIAPLAVCASWQTYRNWRAGHSKSRKSSDTYAM